MSYDFTPSIIDVEASGFGPQSYPIEVGIAMGSGLRYSTLIQPAPGWTYWDKEAEKIHRVRREILEKHGKPIEEVATKLNDLLRGGVVYTDGWVVDTPWINQLFDASGVPRLFQVSPIETILSESQMSLWHDTQNALIRENNLERHRASVDAFIIQETYVRTRQAGQA